MITVTGHLGGSLTHGSTYLTEGLQSGAEQGAAIKPIPNIQEAVVYTDVVQPLLEAKCYSCHGASKQKGKLRLDQQEFILKGGKSGQTMEPGNADESEMIKRMLLPVDNEDHMPPKEKSQLNHNLKLNWTGSKVALIELLYALHTEGVFNNGTSDLKDIAEYFENVFSIDLGQYHRAFLEIRMRKTDKTKFLNGMKEKLIRRMENTDELL